MNRNCRRKASDMSLDAVTGGKIGSVVCTGTVFLLLSFIALMICMLSQRDFLTPNGVPYTDSSVFEYMGRIIASGKVPYKDAFDHKGLLLYFINYLGVLINPRHGIWWIEFVFMFLSVAGIYQISRMFTRKIASIPVVLIVLSMMTIYFEGGNLTEEYALPMQIWALFIYFDYLLNDKISVQRTVICGILFGCVLFIRPNMISVWIVFSLFILVKCIKEKEYQNLCYFILEFFLGVIVVVLPMLVYLIINNAISEFIFDYFVFNKMYSSTTLDMILVAIRSFAKTRVFIIAVLIVFCDFLNGLKERRIIDLVYLLYMALTLLLTGMAGRYYGHYGMILLPTLIYPYALLVSSVQIKKISQIALGNVVCIYMIIILIHEPWKMLYDNLVTKVNSEQSREMVYGDPKFDEMLRYIRTNTSDNQEITVYGNEVAIYNLSDTFSSSVYIFQPGISEEIMDQYYKDISENNPRFIVVSRKSTDRLNEFILKYGYTECRLFGTHFVYGQY